jgi:hypothetical protein
MKKKLLVLLIAASSMLMPNLVFAVAIEITPEAADAALAFSDGFHWGVASVDLSD